jgi:hypothetical protein
MENGFGTADILTGRGLGLGGFGGYNYGGQFADFGSNAVRLNRNEGVTRDAAKCTQDTLVANLARVSDQAEEGRRTAQNTAILTAITNSEFRTSDRLNGITDGMFQAELRNGDRLRDIERQAAAQAAINAQCCCDLKLQACEDKAQILSAIGVNKETMLSLDAGRIRDNNATLQARINQLEIFREGGFGCGGGVRVCPTPA